jgi:hypothetical protein
VPKLLFVGTKAFMKVPTRGYAFLIYVPPSLDVELHPHEIPSQYQEFKDMFEKKKCRHLPKHQPYNSTIDLVEGVQPPFKPIYNWSQEGRSILGWYH